MMEKQGGIKLLSSLLACVLCAMVLLCMGALAESSEADLRRKLQSQCGNETICVFAYGDYDGDGAFEAFALVGTEDEWGMDGDLWFVSAQRAEVIQSGKAYSQAEMIGGVVPMLFYAEENYGGSGSTSHLWRVQGGEPKKMDAGIISEFSYSGEGNEFYSYPSAFDAWDDGTGHTWKRYYFYLDANTMQMREYGGIYINRSELERYAGAATLLQQAEAQGYSIRELIYRANGIVNVNLHSSDGENRFLTLRLSGNEALDVTPGENLGVYLTASNPSVAVYPTGMEAGTSDSSVNTLANSSGTVLNENDGKIFICDPDGDGSSEQIQIVREAVGENVKYIINIADASGWLIGSREIFESADYCEHEFSVCILEGCLYLEARESFEGVATQYMLFALENGRYELIMHLYDPDYSDGAMIGDRLNGETLYETESMRNADTLIGILEKAFAEYGLRFRARSADESVTAILPEDSMICVLNDADLASQTVDQLSQSVQGGQSGFTTTGNVNIRNLPNLNGSIVATVGKGSRGIYLGESSVDNRGVVWYKVQYNGDTGWISSKYAVVGTEAPTQQSVIQSGAQGSFIVSGGKTNIRSAPNLNGTILGSIAAGHGGEYLGESSVDSRGVAWYKIRYKGTIGWVSSKYAYLN